MSNHPRSPPSNADPKAPNTQTAPMDLTADEFRVLGHRLVEQLADFLESIPRRPAAPNTSPTEVRARLGTRPLAELGDEPAALLDRACELLFDGVRINGHPRAWGYIVGSPAPIGALADFIAATVNPNMAARNGAPMAAERAFVGASGEHGSPQRRLGQRQSLHYLRLVNPQRRSRTEEQRP